MFNKTTLRKIIAPAKTQPKADQPSSWLSQARKVRDFLISPDLGAFASLRESQVFPIALFRIGS
jgi:hypothetical protein